MPICSGLEREFEPRFADYALHKNSARNLIHYLALRGRDIRQLQEQLAALGLSSLGRTESHVLAAFEAVLNVVHQLAGQEWRAPAKRKRSVGFIEGKASCARIPTGSWAAAAETRRAHHGHDAERGGG